MVRPRSVLVVDFEVWGRGLCESDVLRRRGHFGAHQAFLGTNLDSVCRGHIQNAGHIGGVRAASLFLSHSWRVLWWTVSARNHVLRVRHCPSASRAFPEPNLDSVWRGQTRNLACLLRIRVVWQFCRHFFGSFALCAGRCCKLWFWIVSTSPSRGNHG